MILSYTDSYFTLQVATQFSMGIFRERSTIYNDQDQKQLDLKVNWLINATFFLPPECM